MRLLPVSSFLTRAALAGAVIFSLGAGLAPAAIAADETPTAAQLRQQRQAAAQLKELAGDQVEKSEVAQTRLGDLAQRAGAALDVYVTARDAARDARAEAIASEARYVEARRVAAEERATMGRFASEAYRNNGSSEQLTMLGSLAEARDVTEMGRMAADLKWVGDQQSFSVDRLAAAQRRADAAAEASAAASERAERMQRQAEEAKLEADRLVAEQRDLVARLVQEAANTKAAARRAEDEAVRMAKARQVAAERARAAAIARAKAIRRNEVVQIQITVPPGACQGADISAYPNGKIPRQALCSLWGAEWHVLRADAAHAFSEMSKAYAREFSKPILVTDSYRSYEAQVACRKAKGNLCADPGTSNHGWGTAVDLGGGAQSFSSPTHHWLQQNGPRFGWFHPSWAQAGGSKPEPWHWEFAGV